MRTFVALLFMTLFAHAQQPTLFAQVDPNTGLVTRVLVIDQATINTGNWGDPSTFHQTWVAPTALQTKNYPGSGYTWNAGFNCFQEPQPYPDWTLNNTTCRWTPPVAYPMTGGPYTWDSTQHTWIASP